MEPEWTTLPTQFDEASNHLSPDCDIIRIPKTDLFDFNAFRPTLGDLCSIVGPLDEIDASWAQEVGTSQSSLAKDEFRMPNAALLTPRMPSAVDAFDRHDAEQALLELDWRTFENPRDVFNHHEPRLDEFSGMSGHEDATQLSSAWPQKSLIFNDEGVENPWSHGLLEDAPVFSELGQVVKDADGGSIDPHATLDCTMDDSPVDAMNTKDVPRLLKRTAISDQAKKVLETSFFVDPYPRTEKMETLALEIGLSIKSVKTWFSNQRSRKTRLSAVTSRRYSCIAEHCSQKSRVWSRLDNFKAHVARSHPGSEYHQLFRISTRQRLSSENLKAHTRQSPSSSTPSLEKYLSTPANEESVPPTISAAANQSTLSKRSRVACDPYKFSMPAPKRTYSVSGSESSIGSAHSGHSFTSQFSVDSRGSRRGRRNWTKAAVLETFDDLFLGDDSNHQQPSSVTSPRIPFESMSLEPSLCTLPSSLLPSELRSPESHSESSWATQIGLPWECTDFTCKEFLKGYATQAERDDHVRAAHPSISDSPLGLTDHGSEPEQAATIKFPYFCTWPSCLSTFRYRFDWARHEEAVHYHPYQWVCCAENTSSLPLAECYICGEKQVTFEHLLSQHFSSCIVKPSVDRIFYREDQLAQHIKRAHGGRHGVKCTVPKAVLQAWRTGHSSPQYNWLKCGFCGISLDNWKQRQNHVFGHLRNGICKHAWWFGRLPSASLTQLVPKQLDCLACGKWNGKPAMAALEHPVCTSWSCRNLHDYHAIFTITRYPPNLAMSTCILCASIDITCSDRDEDYLGRLMGHAFAHRLESCAQQNYSDLLSFQQHLEKEHAGILSQFRNSDMRPWQSLQILEMQEDQVVIRTAQPFTEIAICGSKHPAGTSTTLKFE